MPTSPEPTRARSEPRLDRPLLLSTFVSGGSVMVVEVLGSRVLGPFFGVGLFVWSALLTITLGALALGYYAGGVLSDRRSTPRLVHGLVVIAGVLVALIPPLSRPLLRLGDVFGVRGGSLVSACLLFGPALLVMGMVTTVAVRRAAVLALPGRGVGLVYAVSTLGGLLGTLLAGFVLVPRFAIETTLALTALLLVLTGLFGYLTSAGARVASASLVFPLLALAVGRGNADVPVRVLERAESLHGRLSVIEDTSHGPPLRLLRADHSFVGGHWVETREPAFGFLHLLEAVRLARPEGKRLLQIGLGIGWLPLSLEKDGVRTDVVEIDPEVIRLARKHFGFHDTGEMYAEDARTLIRRLDRRYDFIVHDAFTGGAVPEHLLSAEVLSRLRELLLPGGVLALNFVGAVSGPLDASARAVNRTLRHVFPAVRAFRDGPPEADAHAISNIVFFAAERPLTFAKPGRYASPNCEAVLGRFESWEVFSSGTLDAPVLTDSENPLAVLALPVSEAFRDSMRELYPPEFWLD